ncbi:reverse transcriptase domain-containing protein [uncultured Sphaerochaeta sp.]|uniref:reverse transcriptase domain-containing protein n=1 Tax=uncultured Sphaerochaeta sp. TaxID=886478 RepID=UPI002A0A82D1|nr:reverse transcriptase domain-containing protein [uncultured Sphaerochaeta sp.]
MKRWNVTLEEICDFKNFCLARKEAIKGMRKTHAVLYYLNDENLLKLSKDVLYGTYRVSPPKHFTIIDKYTGKTRTIDAPSLKDKIVQHALVQGMESFMMNYMIQHNLASLPGRGIEYGRRLLRYWAHTGSKAVKYAVKWDIKKYYENININQQINWLAKHVKSQKILLLFHECLYRKDIGLMLGSYLSQWVANLYLSPIDHWIKEDKAIKHYLRYMDDSVAFFSSKKKAKAFSLQLVEKVRDIGLEVKLDGRGAIRIWKWADCPVDMLGYKTYRDGHQTLRAKISLSINRSLNRIEKREVVSRCQARSLLSRRGLVIHSDCKLMANRIDSAIIKYQIKEIAK